MTFPIDLEPEPTYYLRMPVCGHTIHEFKEGIVPGDNTPIQGNHIVGDPTHVQECGCGSGPYDFPAYTFEQAITTEANWHPGTHR